MCALCFEVVPLESLSLVGWPEDPRFTDVCKPCRLVEVALVVRADHMYR